MEYCAVQRQLEYCPTSRKTDQMIVRFSLYSIFKNLRFADPFLLLYLLHLGSSFTSIGLLLGFGAITTAVLEVPAGLFADQWGRIKSVAACFLAYAFSFSLLPFATTADDGERLVCLYAAIASFSLGEALRTGGHKAIMLDWLDSEGRADEATGIIGTTRAWSKGTTGASALGGGLILFLTGDYAWLFYLSAVAAIGGFVLMLTYPSSLEGEKTRERQNAKSTVESSRLLERFRNSASEPGFGRLFVESVTFESQSKLMLKYYLQPWLKLTLEAGGLTIIGLGALSVGAYEFVRNSVGATGALASPWLERIAGGQGAALTLVHRGALLISLALVLCLWVDWLVIGLILMLGLTVLQNGRRPIFVSAFNEVMDKSARATTLSIENQARSVVTAVLLPITGWLADQFGLIAVCMALTGLLLSGLVVGVMLHSTSQPNPSGSP
jgi:MFS family permease